MLRQKEAALASDIEKLKTESKPSTAAKPSTPVMSQAPRTASVASVNDRASTSGMALARQSQSSQPLTGARPDAELRNFNEIDIVGQLERDDKGNLIVEFGNDHDMAKEVYYDLKGQPISIRGYRVDPNTGSIINNKTS
jgi:hypothetical protein